MDANLKAFHPHQGMCVFFFEILSVYFWWCFMVSPMLSSNFQTKQTKTNKNAVVFGSLEFLEPFLLFGFVEDGRFLVLQVCQRFVVEVLLVISLSGYRWRGCG